MSGSYSVVMGDRGRFVVPAELRERLGLLAGTPLVLLERDGGFLKMTRDQAKQALRESLAGADLEGDLVAERRRAAEREDAETIVR